MFIKLIKYDLKYLFKSIRIFIVLFLASIILFNLTSYTVELILDPITHDVIDEIAPPSIIMFLHSAAYLAIFTFIFGLIFMTLMSIWRRFKTNFYSDEGYLTHTLPITRSTLWNAKVCGTLLIIFCLVIVFGLGAGLLAFTKNGLELLQSIGLVNGCTGCVGQYYFVEPCSLSYYLSLIFALYTQLSFIAFCGLTGIIIGHRFTSHRNTHAVLAGFAIYLICALILVGLIFLYSQINPELAFIFESTESSSINPTDAPNLAVHSLVGASLVYSIYIVGAYFLNRQLLKRGINLD